MVFMYKLRCRIDKDYSFQGQSDNFINLRIVKEFLTASITMFSQWVKNLYRTAKL